MAKAGLQPVAIDRGVIVKDRKPANASCQAGAVPSQPQGWFGSYCSTSCTPSNVCPESLPPAPYLTPRGLRISQAAGHTCPKQPPIPSLDSAKSGEAHSVTFCVQLSVAYKLFIIYLFIS